MHASVSLPLQLCVVLSSSLILTVELISACLNLSHQKMSGLLKMLNFRLADPLTALSNPLVYDHSPTGMCFVFLTGGVMPLHSFCTSVFFFTFPPDVSELN